MTEMKASIALGIIMFLGAISGFLATPNGGAIFDSSDWSLSAS